jgi:hypothetical protein
MWVFGHEPSIVLGKKFGFAFRSKLAKVSQLFSRTNNQQEANNQQQQPTTNNNQQPTIKS